MRHRDGQETQLQRGTEMMKREKRGEGYAARADLKRNRERAR